MPARAENAWHNVRTIGDAKDFVSSLFDRQLDRCILEATPPNVTCPGDSEARQAFLTLLPPVHQRILFLRKVKNTSFWPRVRTLVGSPPFSFLKQEDNEVLRAGGINCNRSNMAHSVASTPSSTEFGTAQFEDAHERDFKVVFSSESSVAAGNSGEGTESQNLPFVGLAPGSVVVMDVRLRRRTISSKTDIIRGASSISKKALVFPRAGEHVHMVPTRNLKRVADEMTITVTTVAGKASRSVARLVCKIV